VGLRDYAKNYTTTAPRPLLTLNFLEAFEERLPAADFVSVYRSYIVALGHIDSIRKNRIHLGEAVIPVSDSYTEAFNRSIAQRNMH
jgi:two-component system LytT family response regulator